MTDKVQLGFYIPSGDPYYVPIHHTVITGMTDSGKTTAGERILRGRKGKSLVFLTKRGEKIFQDAPRIPPYYRERFDWEYMRSLLEATMKEKLKFETPWIIRIAKQTQVELKLKDLNINNLAPGEALEVAYKLLAGAIQTEKMREFDRNQYILLHAYLGKVLPTLLRSKTKFSSALELSPGVNAMDLTEWYLEEQVQMLCMRAAMEHLLQKGNDTLTALPEAWKNIPQERNTPVKLVFEKFIREGATNNNFLLVDAQDLRGVDKTHLGQCYIWIIGKMIEANEVERLLKQTLGVGVRARTIQRLQRGHFIVVNGLENTVDQVYVWPYGAPESASIEVAKGIRTPESVRDEFLKVKVMEEDLMYKEKFEEEQKKRIECEKEFARQLEHLTGKAREQAYAEALKKVDEIKKQWNIDEYQQTICQLKDEKAMLETALKQLEPLKAFGEALAKFLTEIGATTTSTPGAIPIMPSMTVAEVDERINQRVSSGPSPVPVVQVDVDERIKELVKNEVVNRIVTKIQALPEPAKKAAWWLHEKRETNIRALYNYMFDRPPEETGRIPGTFYMNVVNPLQDAWLIVNEKGSIRWILQEKLEAELKEVLTDSDLENVPKYLASLLL